VFDGHKWPAQVDLILLKPQRFEGVGSCTFGTVVPAARQFQKGFKLDFSKGLKLFEW